MRVAVLYNDVSAQDTLEDQDVLVQADVVSQSLKRLGHENFTVPCTLDLDSMKKNLRRLQPDVVFNLVEALEGNDSLVYLPPAVLDTLGLPYTGGSAESLFLTTHKLLAKERLLSAGLPTPPWIVQDAIREEDEKPSVIGPHPSPLRAPTEGWSGEGTDLGPHPSPLRAPTGTIGHRREALVGMVDWSGDGIIGQWIIKGVWEQASRDMDDEAVFAGDVREVERRLHKRVKRTGRPAFAEKFIEGREFNLALLTSRRGDCPDFCVSKNGTVPFGKKIGTASRRDVVVLPPAEIDFSAFPPEKPRIVGHRAKWQADSFEYNNTPRRYDFPVADQSLLNQLQDLARRCWRLFMLRGWARVDFRVDQDGRPWILEVNANPCLSPDAGFAAALQQAGVTLDKAIEHILDETLAC
jgi:D-alanine-D-alanine ligase